MLREITTTNQLEPVMFMPLPDGKADVFVYKFLSDTTDDSGNVSYRYLTNEFRTNKLSKDDILADPDEFMNYFEKEETLEEKLIRLENELQNMTYALKQLTENIYEVSKKENSDLPTGDFLNPIHIPENGITIQNGLFYYVDDKELPHEAKEDAFVTREDFNDHSWFDWV